jgi:hypothetical protein
MVFYFSRANRCRIEVLTISYSVKLNQNTMTKDVNAALTALKNSKFRSRFKMTDKDRQYIRDKGISTIRSHAVDFITTRLAPAFPKNDGKQTPMKGHPVFIAQHATATCCRGCLKKWYQIEKGRALTDNEIGFVVDLLMGWIRAQDRPL